MADIDIERKGKSPLPWILGLLALALLAFLLMQSCGGDEVDEDAVIVADTTPTLDATTDGTVPFPGDTGVLVPGGVETTTPPATTDPGL